MTTPVSFVATGALVYEDTGAPTITLAPPAGIQVNDLLLAAIASASGTYPSNVPAGWTLIDQWRDPSPVCATSLYRRWATASEPANYTWTTPGGYQIGAISAYRGADLSNPIADVQHVAGGSGDTITAPSVTALMPGSYLVCFFNRFLVIPMTPGFTTPTGMSERFDSAFGFIVGCAAAYDDEALVAAGATGTRTTTVTNGHDAVALSVLIGSTIAGNVYVQDVQGGQTGIMLGGDRSAWHMDYEDLHASDIAADAPTRHNPLGTVSGQSPIWDGTKWVAGTVTNLNADMLDGYHAGGLFDLILTDDAFDVLVDDAGNVLVGD